MNLDTTIDLDLKAFFQWWGRELAFLLPLRLRQRLRDRQGRLIVSSGAETFLLWHFRDDAVQSQAEAQLVLTDAASFQALRQQNPAFDKAERVLRLSPDQGLYRILYLPAAVQENLSQVVRFELDRYTPFKPEQLYFSVQVLDKTESGQLRVLLVLTPHTVLDPLLAQLDGLGFRPHRVEYPVAREDIDPNQLHHNLLPEHFQETGARLGQFLHGALHVLVLLLLLAVMVWPVWQEGEAVERVKQAIKALDKQTQRVEAQQQEIDALHAETQKLIDTKRQTPALSAMLSELTKRLNDDTWLTHLQYADKHLQIQGQSPAASALIGVLEASDFFNNVSFVSPLTQDKTTGRERFQISMDVVMPLEIANDEGTEEASGEAETVEDSAAGDEADTSQTDTGVAGE